MSGGGQVWVRVSLCALAVTFALASCSDSNGGASSAAQAGAFGAGGASGADGAGDNAAGPSAGSGPRSYADAGAPGAVPVCTTTQLAQCEVGEALVTSTDRYCPYCRTCAADEKSACPAFTCGPAAHREMAPGQCCSACVPNDRALCTAEQQAYVEQRKPLVDQFLALCTKDADCSSALVNTPCEQACVASLRDLAQGLAADLSALACPACPLQPPVSLRPGGHCLPATCLNGVCVAPALADK